MQTPSLKFLRTFHVAGRRGSFKLAADDLCITASAVSHQIKVLEEQLGLALFERGAHSLTLTEAGSYYLQSIDALFVRLQSVTEQLQSRFRKQLVRVQVPPFFATELLLPRLSCFSAANADVDIHVNTYVGPHAEHAAEADVSVLVGNGSWGELVVTRLFAQRYVAACAPQLLLHRPVSTPHDLDDQTLIVHARRLDLWDRWTAMQGVTALHPRQLIRLDSMADIVQAAEQGVGFALVSAPLASERLAGGSLRQVLDCELVTGESYYLVTRPEDAAHLAVRSLMDWMLREFGQPA